MNSVSVRAVKQAGLRCTAGWTKRINSHHFWSLERNSWEGSGNCRSTVVRGGGKGQGRKPEETLSDNWGIIIIIIIIIIIHCYYYYSLLLLFIIIIKAIYKAQDRLRATSALWRQQNCLLCKQTDWHYYQLLHIMKHSSHKYCLFPPTYTSSWVMFHKINLIKELYRRSYTGLANTWKCERLLASHT